MSFKTAWCNKQYFADVSISVLEWRLVLNLLLQAWLLANLRALAVVALH